MHLPGNSSGDSPFVHDDSGFFEAMSDDERRWSRVSRAAFREEGVAEGGEGWREWR